MNITGVKGDNAPNFICNGKCDDVWPQAYRVRGTQTCRFCLFGERAPQGFQNWREWCALEAKAQADADFRVFQHSMRMVNKINKARSLNRAGA